MNVKRRYSEAQGSFTCAGQTRFDRVDDVPVRHRLLAGLVAVCWGVNFIAIHLTLGHFPPMFSVALRFGLIAVPTLILVPRPQVPLRWLMGYGLGFGVLQFLFLYWAMAWGMPTGLASLVLQASAPLTVLLGAGLLRERLSRRQLIGVLVAATGLAVVGWRELRAAALLPFLLTLAGAFGWALGNLASRQAHPPRPMRLMLWMSVVPPLPLLVVSLLVEGPARIGTAFATVATRSGWLALGGLTYTVVIGTIVGSGLWTWLMSRHPAGVVAPFSMLVPAVGLLAAWAVLGERVGLVELVGAVLVICGVLYGSLRRRRAVGPAPAPAGVQADG